MEEGEKISEEEKLRISLKIPKFLREFNRFYKIDIKEKVLIKK